MLRTTPTYTPIHIAFKLINKNLEKISTMKNYSFLSFLLFTTFLLLHTAVTAFQDPSSAITTNNTEFIRTNCLTTSFPELCFKSLLTYATTINQDPFQLACVAIRLSLSKVKRMGNYVSKLSTPQPVYKYALQDCNELFDDAAYRTSESLKQMRHLNGTRESLSFQFSNVKTWMSAAYASEDTCTEGFKESPDGSMKDDVIYRVSKVMKCTGIAIDLVDTYAQKVTTP